MINLFVMHTIQILKIKIKIYGISWNGFRNTESYTHVGFFFKSLNKILVY